MLEKNLKTEVSGNEYGLMLNNWLDNLIRAMKEIPGIPESTRKEILRILEGDE